MVDKTTNDDDGYDLSSTGTIIELDASDIISAGWQVTAGTAADYEVEIDIDDTTHVIDTYSDETRVDGGAWIPEANTIRIKNTSTAQDTAAVGIGGADR